VGHWDIKRHKDGEAGIGFARVAVVVEFKVQFASSSLAALQ
jgi:hypothetical protein